jgi:hypothetical protein
MYRENSWIPRARHLKKVVLKGMEEESIIEKIHIRQGKVDEEGNRQDIVTSKKMGRILQPNVAPSKEVQFRWRLILEETWKFHQDVKRREQTDLKGE